MTYAAKATCWASVVPALLLISLVPAAAQRMVPWLTRSADNSRSGWNPHESVLSQDSITNKGITRVGTISLPGDLRGVEAQPLIVPNVRISDGSTHDLLLLATMADNVVAIDAHDRTTLWQTKLGMPIQGSSKIDMHVINDHWGCLSTGVVDPDLKRLYQVCWVSPDQTGKPETARYYMFVFNLADGKLVVPRVLIAGTSQNQSYNSQMRKQRSSLAEINVGGRKTVIGCSGTVFETGRGASGYCFAFDVAGNNLTTLLALTAGAGAGVWMAGQGPAVDDQGNLYLVTGNGDFDGSTQWGESFLKLRYTPPSGASTAKLEVVDHWTPWTDFGRTGQKASLTPMLAGTSAPTHAVRPVGGQMSISLKNAKTKISKDENGAPIPLVFPAMATGNWSDEDWGSAGPACIFAIGVCVAAGKDGIGYPIKTSNMGGTTLADLANPPSNCAKLAGPPVWLTMSPGPVDPCPTDPTTLNFFPWGKTAHLHMTPVQYFDPVLNAWTIFAWGENSNLHKWSLSSAGALTYVAQSHEFASANVRMGDPTHPTGGMPGGFCSGSSNGADPASAILVCTIPYGDANSQVVNGRLLIYDPVHLATDGSLKVLWDSERFTVPFVYNKFNPPVIDGGQIYVANYSGGVDVYALGSQ